MKIEFEFLEGALRWCGRAWSLPQKECILDLHCPKPDDLVNKTALVQEIPFCGGAETHLLFRKPGKGDVPPGQKIFKKLPDPLGVNAATINLLKEMFPKHFRRHDDLPNTQSEFIRFFIDNVQRKALDLAALEKEIITPINFTEEYWTPIFIKQLAKVLASPNKRRDNLRIKDYLVFNWDDLGLCKLTREELAARVNKDLKLSIRPNAIWQTAYRIGLLSKRNPGPPPRNI